MLVHLHVYYHDQVDYFIKKLGNIQGPDWDLVVTYSHYNEETERKLRELKSTVRFIEVNNIGYDIWPFIKALQTIDIDSYDYVMKLHTKRSVRRCTANVIPMKGFEWRDALVDGMLYNKDYFQKVLEKMEGDREVGMISNLKTYSKRNWESYRPGIEKELGNLGLKCEGNHFCMGTMFIAKTEVLKPLLSPYLTEELFKDTLTDTKRDFTSAHYYERLLSVLPSAIGMKHLALSPKLSEFLKIKTMRFLEIPVRWIFGVEKKGPQKRKFIRIFGLEFYIEPPKE